MDKLVVVVVFAATLVLDCYCQSYSIPTPTLELLSPQGFRMSIPDESGIVLYAFHGSINQPLTGIQRGDFYGEVTQAVNGKWQYENRKVFLDPGDVLYYWIHVQHGTHAYRLLGKSVTIPGGSNDSRPTTNTPPIRDRTTGTTSTTTRPTQSSSKDCETSLTTVNGRKVCRGALVFSDEFKTLNTNKWQRDIRIPSDKDDADFVSFQNRAENCYIRDGNLVIVPNLLEEVPGFDAQRIRYGELDLGVNCTGIEDVKKECNRRVGGSAGGFSILPPIVSAKIRTKDFFSFRYGKVVVRAKMPTGDWLFPLIALEPAVNYYGISGFASGQMRVAFIHGNEYLVTKEGYEIDGRKLSGGVILASGEKFRGIWTKSSVRANHLGNDFHVYSMTWTDETISLSIDDNEYAVMRGGFRDAYETHDILHAQSWISGDYMAPFDKEFYISIGVSAGGISDFPNGCQNGRSRKLKPWDNTSPKAELKFWRDRENWLDTWQGENSGLQVDYIRVYAL